MSVVTFLVFFKHNLFDILFLFKKGGIQMICRLYYLVDDCSHILAKYLDPMLEAQKNSTNASSVLTQHR